MSYRLIALDIDGTLIDKSQRVSPANERAIREARDRGVLVTLATGRMFTAARPVARQLGIDLPLITYQGSLIRTALSEETLYRRDIEAEAGLGLVDFLYESKNPFFLYVDDLLVAAVEDERTERYRTRSPEVEIKIVGDLQRWFRASDDRHALTKVVYLAPQEEMQKQLRRLEERFGADLELTLTYPEFLEIGPKGIHKGSALIWLADHFGIPIGETMVIGDSTNDIDMFRVAGLSVAVADGQEGAKAAAQVITAACEEDGVAAAIQRYVLAAR